MPGRPLLAPPQGCWRSGGLWAWRAVQGMLSGFFWGPLGGRRAAAAVGGGCVHSGQGAPPPHHQPTSSSLRAFYLERSNLPTDASTTAVKIDQVCPPLRRPAVELRQGSGLSGPDSAVRVWGHIPAPSPPHPLVYHSISPTSCGLGGVFLFAGFSRCQQLKIKRFPMYRTLLALLEKGKTWLSGACIAACLGWLSRGTYPGVTHFPGSGSPRI